MRSRNIMEKPEYLMENLYWFLLAMFWYHSVLFCPLPGMPRVQSQWILWGAGLGLVGVGTALTWKRRRNYLSILVNVLLPFELYSLMTLRQTWGAWMLPVCAGAAVLAAVWFFWVLRVNLREQKPAAPAVRHGFMGGRTVFVCVLALCWIPLLLPGARTEEAVSTPASAAAETRMQALASRQEAVARLEETAWQTLSRQEKLEVLQAVADLEAGYLGLPHTLTVCGAELGQTVAGCYRDSDHEIHVNLSLLDHGTSLRLVQTVCHETYHAYQRRLCDAWRTAAPEYQNMLCFAGASQFAENFANYIDGEENFEAYEQQTCEETAREYALSAVRDYEMYLSRKQP